ncbi:MAG: hypothetical protein J3K34DRAFT_402777 [Monoraphidium minutum]|nr:MAG: hypothetical protein J3K34DRAFT_402777 [Monoraphidium minutum]
MANTEARLRNGAAELLAGGPSLAALSPQSVAPREIRVADLFTITYYGTWKLATNLVTNQHYVLYQCGTPNPMAAGVGGIPADAKAFSIPLTSLAVPDTTALAFVGMGHLKLHDRVVATPTFCTDACGQFIVATCGARADPEPVEGKPELGDRVKAGVVAAADAVLVSYPSGNDKEISISAPGTPPAIRPQWLKFIGAFFNREGTASLNADSRMRDYSRKRRAALEVANRNGNKPKVLWIAAQDVYKTWGYPRQGVQYIIFGAKFKKTYVEDAGGEFLNGHSLLSEYTDRNLVDKELFSADNEFKDVAINPNHNAALAKTILLKMMKMADVIIDESYHIRPVNARSIDVMLAMYKPATNHPTVILPWEVAEFPAFKNQRVYTPGKRLNTDGSGTDWFESAMVDTDRVLDDFITAITPAAREGSPTTKWLHRLGVDPIDYTRISRCQAIKTCVRRPPLSTCANHYYKCRHGTLAPGKRISHCPSSSCRIRCQCCRSGIPQSCAKTCASADTSKCPR